MTQRVGGRDRPTSGARLSRLELAMLDIVMRAFFRGLIDGVVRREATLGLAPADRSLRAVYTWQRKLDVLG